jgi:hypothetical protein
MYRDCHLCGRSLGSNRVVRHMPVGRRLAFDPEKGRLWVVCRRCGEWNLSPLEERWEALEECERLVADAPVRASSKHVGLARVRGLEIIRVGAALRDELANWRYLPRLRLRRRIATARRIAIGSVAGAILGGALLAGILIGSFQMLAWCAVTGTMFALYVARSVAPERAIGFTDSKGTRFNLGGGRLENVELVRERSRDRRQRGTRVGVRVSASGSGSEFDGLEVLRVLARVLPRMNWEGGSETQLAAAVRIVDGSEAALHDATDAKRERKPAWRSIALAFWPASDRLVEMNGAARLALEMAVTEELERRDVVRDAAAYVPRSREAEEIAAIADDMFVPRFVSDWLERWRAGQGDHERGGR